MAVLLRHAEHLAEPCYGYWLPIPTDDLSVLDMLDGILGDPHGPLDRFGRKKELLAAGADQDAMESGDAGREDHTDRHPGTGPAFHIETSA